MATPVKQAPRRYFIEFNGAMLLYLATVFGRRHAADVADPTLKALILLSPILPTLLATLAVVRFYRRMDEYHKLQLLQALAISAAVTAVVSVSWGFLEDIGFPHLQIMYAWLVMALTWAAAALYFGWKEKVSEGRGWRSLAMVLVTLAYVAAGTATFWVIGVVAGFATPWPELVLVGTVLFIIRMGFVIFSKKSAAC